MIEPRLASKIQISSLIKLTEIAGGFAAVLKKGDPVSGAILLVARVRGKDPAIYERFPTIDGTSEWQHFPQKTAVSEEGTNAGLKKRTDRDPDLWLIELDVPDEKRLAEILTD